MTIQKILLDFDPEEKNILPVVKKIVSTFGCLERDAAHKVAEYFSVSLSKIFETASFYDEVKFKNESRVVLEICSSPSCVGKNALELIGEIENFFKVKLNDESNERAMFRTMSCLGRCNEGPILKINGEVFTQVSKAKLYEILESF